jgi:hypothetical protein
MGTSRNTKSLICCSLIDTSMDFISDSSFTNPASWRLKPVSSYTSRTAQSRSFSSLFILPLGKLHRDAFFHPFTSTTESIASFNIIAPRTGTRVLYCRNSSYARACSISEKPANSGQCWNKSSENFLRFMDGSDGSRGRMKSS